MHGAGATRTADYGQVQGVPPLRSPSRCKAAGILHPTLVPTRFLSHPSLPPCSNEVLAPSTACTLLQQALQFLMHDYSDQCLAMIRTQ